MSEVKKYHFFVDGKKFETEHKSINGADIKKIAGIDPTYQVFLEEEGDTPDKPISDSAGNRTRRKDQAFFCCASRDFRSSMTPVEQQFAELQSHYPAALLTPQRKAALALLKSRLCAASWYGSHKSPQSSSWRRRDFRQLSPTVSARAGAYPACGRRYTRSYQ